MAPLLCLSGLFIRQPRLVATKNLTAHDDSCLILRLVYISAIWRRNQSQLRGPRCLLVRNHQGEGEKKDTTGPTAQIQALPRKVPLVRQRVDIDSSPNFHAPYAEVASKFLLNLQISRDDKVPIH